jgi:hypothetical protein
MNKVLAARKRRQAVAVVALTAEELLSARKIERAFPNVADRKRYVDAILSDLEKESQFKG